ncbi:MAG: restriction endonuclease subunit S [Chryseotalea sp. WA131a]|nr:MAG: restriction endonuclease subunit S [Chryseotalea sp. WA131a]
MSKAVPKLRFKEFKGDWINKKLGEVVSNKSGKYNPARDEGSTKCIELEHLSSETGQLLGFANAKELASIKNTFRKGDVLFGKLRPYLKKFLLAPFDGVCSSEIWVLTGNGISNNFLYQIVQRNTFVDLANLSSGSKMPRADWDVVSSGLLIFPSLPEQQKIASFLSAVDEKIHQLTRKKELLEQYKKGVMQQLFCLHYDSSDSGDGHDGLSNQGNQKNHSKSQCRQLRFKDENGKAYPKWEEKRLGDIGDIVSGLTYSPMDVNADGVLVLRSSNVQNRRLTFEDNVYVKVSAGEFNPVKENDILICVRNGSKNLIGKNALIDRENAGVAFGAFMTVYRSYFNSFLFHYFDTDSYKDEVHKNLGATINSINGSDLKKFKIPFPCKEEQQKIASFLSAIDTKIESVAIQIEKTQTFKKGLLQQMFV